VSLLREAFAPALLLAACDFRRLPAGAPASADGPRTGDPWLRS
jgi:hypothetical protein